MGRKRIMIALLMLIVAVIGIYSVARPLAPDPNTTYVTLIGYTEVTTGRHVDTIGIKNVPSGQWPFHVVLTVREGTRLKLISYDANDALVEAPNGVRGYVGVYAVRELCGSDCP